MSATYIHVLNICITSLSAQIILKFSQSKLSNLHIILEYKNVFIALASIVDLVIKLKFVATPTSFYDFLLYRNYSKSLSFSQLNVELSGLLRCSGSIWTANRKVSGPNFSIKTWLLLLGKIPTRRMASGWALRLRIRWAPKLVHHENDSIDSMFLIGFQEWSNP